MERSICADYLSKQQDGILRTTGHQNMKFKTFSCKKDRPEDVIIYKYFHCLNKSVLPLLIFYCVYFDNNALAFIGNTCKKHIRVNAIRATSSVLFNYSFGKTVAFEDRPLQTLPIIHRALISEHPVQTKQFEIKHQSCKYSVNMSRITVLTKLIDKEFL